MDEHIGPHLSEYVEIEEAGLRRANQLLAAGFTLIATGQRVWEQNRRVVAPNDPASATFIQRDFKYVIGRLDGQPAFPPRETTARKEEANV